MPNKKPYEHALLEKLVACPSVSPADAGCMEIVKNALETLGFEVEIIKLGDVTNLWATRGEGKNLCFLGHVDVVPAGSEWTDDPYTLTERDGFLYGRGVVDMKGEIACFIAAVRNQDPALSGKISVLLTSNEEDYSKDGTEAVVALLKERNVKIDAVLVGEPTGTEDQLEIKLGRRGSVRFKLTVTGISGHIAYPTLTDNPLVRIATFMEHLRTHPLDNGTDAFEPSNVGFTRIFVENEATNVIPGEATVWFGVRYNTLHKADDVARWIRSTCAQFFPTFVLEAKPSGDGYLGSDAAWVDLLQNAVFEATGTVPLRTTTGGTTDGRFIIELCAAVAELGLSEETMHKPQERTSLKRFYGLTEQYGAALQRFFAG